MNPKGFSMKSQKLVNSIAGDLGIILPASMTTTANDGHSSFLLEYLNYGAISDHLKLSVIIGIYQGSFTGFRKHSVPGVLLQQSQFKGNIFLQIAKFWAQEKVA